MKTSSAKAKGRALQQWTAEQISTTIGMPWGADQPIASREMGQQGVDIRLVGGALDKFPFSVECKNQQSWSVPAWIRQAQANQIEGTEWLVVAKRNREKPVIIMDGEAFFKMYKEYSRLKTKNGIAVIGVKDDE